MNPPPNILWIGTDEQHRGSIGCYGSANCRTPHVDALAAESMVFDQAFSPMAVCAPTRASILTGKLPSEGSVIGNGDMEFTMPFREITKKEVPLPTWVPALKEAGYRCVHVGKWHVLPEWEDRPSHFGFEGPDWPGFGQIWDEEDYRDYRVSIGLPRELEFSEEIHALHPMGGSPFEPKSARLAGPVEGSLPYFVAEKTIESMREVASAARAGERPFFLRCEFWGPHIPCIVTEPFYSMYDPAALQLPENFGVLGENKPEIHANMSGGWGIATHPEDVQRRFIASYLGYVSCIDAQVGRMLAALDALGLAENTIVVYTSDHGDSLGAHGIYDKGPFMYDDIYRVPLIVRWPGTVRPGRSDALVYNMDMGATMWEVAGAPVPPGGSARSLLPVLRGEAANLGREAIICELWLQWDFYPQAMAHSGREKFVYNFGGTDEYYDLATDPGELRNRIRDPAVRDRAQTLKTHLHNWMKQVKSPMLEGFERTQAAKAL